jgi:hypothetical protein
MERWPGNKETVDIRSNKSIISGGFRLPGLCAGPDQGPPTGMMIFVLFFKNIPVGFTTIRVEADGRS